MEPSNWNDEKIISSLKELPKIEDSRSKEMLYQNISSHLNEAAFQKKKRKNSIKILPSLAIAAVFAILLLIVPPIFQDGMQYESVPKTADEGQNKLFATQEKQYKYLGSLQEVPENQEMITMYYPDDAARFLVPLTFTVEKGEKTKFEQIRMILDNFDPSEYGLEDSLLKDLNLTEAVDHKTVNIVVPEMYLGKIGDTGENLLLETVERTLSDLGYDKAIYMSEGMVGVSSPNRGKIDEVDIPKNKTKGYIPYVSSTGYLLHYVPDLPQEDLDITNVMELLQQSEEGLFPEPILSKVQTRMKKVSDTELEINFANAPKLDESNKNIALLDAILLTANKYNYKTVTLKGVSGKKIGPYKLDSSIPVPAGPNYVKDVPAFKNVSDPTSSTSDLGVQILLNPLAINNVSTGDSYKNVLEQFGDPLKLEDNKEGTRLLYYSKKGAAIKVQVNLKNEKIDALAFYPEYLNEKVFTAIPRSKKEIIETFGEPGEIKKGACSDENGCQQLFYQQKEPKKTMEVKLKPDGETIDSIEITN